VITPRIISDGTQAREATEELRRKLPGLESVMPKAPKGPPPDALAPSIPPK